MATSWPPALADLNRELNREPEENDPLLVDVLAAVIAFVERIHRGRYNFANDDGSLLPDVPADMAFGARMLAKRYHVRRDSPAGLVSLGELGASRVPSFDTDIDRMLRVGRFAPAVFA